MPDSVFGVEKPEQSPGFLLWQTTVLWQRLIKKALTPYDMAHSHFVTLAIILWFHEQEQAVTQATVAEWSKMDKMTVSKAVSKLSARGLLTQEGHAYDGRALSTRLTTAGVELARILVGVVEKVDGDFFSVLSGKKQERLTGLLCVLTGFSYADKKE